MGSKEFLTDKTSSFPLRRPLFQYSIIPSFRLGGKNRNTFRNSMLQIGIRNSETSYEVKFGGKKEAF